MKKRIISLLVAVSLVVACCAPAFADDLVADVSGVDVIYNNKIDYSCGNAAFEFSNGESPPSLTTVKLNKVFNLPSGVTVTSMTSPTIWACFYNNFDIEGINGAYSGKYYSFGGAGSGGRITFEFTFQGQNDNFMSPDIIQIEASTLKIFNGEVSAGRTYRYPYPSDVSLTVSATNAPNSSLSKYYTYSVTFNPDIIGFNFDRIKFRFGFSDGGDYHFTPVLRGVSVKYMTENEYNNSLDKEKDEAGSSGNENVDKLTGALGDVDSSSLLDAFGDLVSVMSYDGTDSTWTMPAIYLPEIPGVMDRIDLSQEKEIDLCFFMDKIPSQIVTLIRALFDIALVVFCAKELYSFIQYLLTLKGGGSGE